MDWQGLSYSTLTAQSEFEVRFFDRGPIPYSQVIPLFTGTMPAPLRHLNKNTGTNCLMRYTYLTAEGLGIIEEAVSYRRHLTNTVDFNLFRFKQP